MFVCFNDIKQQAVARNMDNFSLREAVFVDLVDEIFLSSVSLISKAKLFWGGDKQLMAFSIKGSTKNKDTMNCPEKAMKISLSNPNQSAPSIYIMIVLCYFSLDQWEIRIHLLCRVEICQCRQCRRQCKIFASGVNFSIFTHFFVFLSLKLLKLGEIDGVKFLAWKSDGVKFLTNFMSDCQLMF